MKNKLKLIKSLIPFALVVGTISIIALSTTNCGKKNNRYIFGVNSKFESVGKLLGEDISGYTIYIKDTSWYIYLANETYASIISKPSGSDSTYSFLIDHLGGTDTGTIYNNSANKRWDFWNVSGVLTREENSSYSIELPSKTNNWWWKVTLNGNVWSKVDQVQVFDDPYLNDTNYVYIESN